MTFAWLVISLVGILLQGVVVRDLWAWFVVPPTGFGFLTLAEALGLVTFAMVFATRTYDDPAGLDEGARNKLLLKRALAAALYALFSWGIGAILRQFV